MWTKLDDTDMTRLEKLFNNIKWQYYGVIRHIKLAKSISKGITRWWSLRQACKKANKKLLKMAKKD